MTASARLVAWVVGGALALAVGAQISVPMVPVPTTLQTLALCVVALAGGPRAGLGAATLYLLGVGLGLPILSSGQQYGGLSFLEFAAAGYVVGFLGAGWLGGVMAQRRSDFGGLLGAALVAHAVVFAVGVPVLGLWIGPGEAIEVGLLRFVPGAVAKSLVAAGMAWALRRGEGSS